MTKNYKILKRVCMPLAMTVLVAVFGCFAVTFAGSPALQAQAATGQAAGSALGGKVYYSGYDKYLLKNGKVYEWDNGRWDYERNMKIKNELVYEYDDGRWQLEGDTTVKSGVTYTTYKNVAVVAKVKSTKTSATIAKTVVIDGRTYKVSRIAPKVFKGTKVTKVTVKSTTLTKAHVKNSLKGSKVKTVVVPKAKLAKYKKYFAKANSGKKVTVKKASSSSTSTKTTTSSSKIYYFDGDKYKVVNGKVYEWDKGRWEYESDLKIVNGKLYEWENGRWQLEH